MRREDLADVQPGRAVHSHVVEEVEDEYHRDDTTAERSVREAALLVDGRENRPNNERPQHTDSGNQEQTAPSGDFHKGCENYRYAEVVDHEPAVDTELCRCRGVSNIIKNEM